MKISLVWDWVRVVKCPAIIKLTTCIVICQTNFLVVFYLYTNIISVKMIGIFIYKLVLLLMIRMQYLCTLPKIKMLYVVHTVSG